MQQIEQKLLRERISLSDDAIAQLMELHAEILEDAIARTRKRHEKDPEITWIHGTGRSIPTPRLDEENEQIISDFLLLRLAKQIELPGYILSKELGCFRNSDRLHRLSHPPDPAHATSGRLQVGDDAYIPDPCWAIVSSDAVKSLVGYPDITFPAIALAKERDVQTFWFFSHDEVGAGRGFFFDYLERVWEIDIDAPFIPLAEYARRRKRSKINCDMIEREFPGWVTTPENFNEKSFTLYLPDEITRPDGSELYLTVFFNDSEWSVICAYQEKAVIDFSKVKPILRVSAPTIEGAIALAKKSCKTLR